MSVLIIQSEVEDYDRWRAAYDSNRTFREQSGIARERVLRSVDEGNRVTLILEGELEQLRSFAGSAELRQRMQDAGVAGAPTMTFAEDT